MAKGIIVIETGEIPKSCHQCNQVDDTQHCRWAGIYVDYRVKPDEKYPCCPIKPMPKKKEITKTITSNYDGRVYPCDPYMSGWNACIDELMGGSDEKA